MYSSLISKIEKAKQYAEEPERISFKSLEVAFRGDNGTHAVSLKGDEWSCECEHFHTSGLCAHVMTLQRVFGVNLSDNALERHHVGAQPARMEVLALAGPFIALERDGVGAVVTAERYFETLEGDPLG